MRFRSVLLVATTVLLLVPASPAAAHISSFEYGTLHSYCADTECETYEYEWIRGTITCAAGERFRIVAKLIDSPSYAGRGTELGTCTGQTQTFFVHLDNESGVGDSLCPFHLAMRAKTKAGGELHDTASFVYTC